MAEGYSWSDKPASDEAALVAQVKVHATPLEPLDTGVEPILPRLPGIKAVVFDIYGTLIISGTGDISLAANSDREESFRWALEAGGFAATADARDQGIRLSEVFHAEIEANRQRTIAAGTPFPEIEIREIWASALAGMLSREEIADRSSQGITPARIERMAVEFEVRVNPVWAMPDLVEMLTVLRKQGLKLGIVSNAQFYTPLLFTALAGDSLNDLGFAEDLRVWSFVEREGKPSRALYRALCEKLAAHGIKPEEAVFIGNDMRNDIAPAAAEGLRTVLFAGDSRSLRWRTGDPLVEGVKADFTVTSLSQLLGLFE